jgi:hypothetical protein
MKPGLHMKKHLIFPLLLVPALLYGATLVPTTVDPKKEKRREKKFEDWIPLAEWKARFADIVDPGTRIPVWIERDGGKIRDLFIACPADCQCWVWYDLKKQVLLRKNKKYEEQGYVLISLHEYEQDGKTQYAAIWVSESGEKRILKEMDRLGLTPGRIE